MGPRRNRRAIVLAGIAFAAVAAYVVFVQVRSRVADRCLNLHADLALDEAERCYASLERIDRTDWRWPYYRAVAASERSDNLEVIAALNSAISRNPDIGATWLRLGDAEFKERHNDRARDAWQRAISTPGAATPAEGTPARVGGATASEIAKIRLARLAALDAAPSQAPPDANALVDPLIDALAARSHNATFLIQQATIAPNNDLAWREFLLRRALDVDAMNADALLALAKHERRTGRCDAALDLLRRYQQASPGDASALVETAGCLLTQGHAADAEPLLRRALASGLDDAPTHYSLGVVLARLGRAADAQSEYALTLQRDPDHVDARNNVAVGLARAGRFDEALHELNLAAAVDPGRAETHSNLGVVLASIGRRDDAIREFQEALRLDPRQDRARAGLQALGR